MFYTGRDIKQYILYLRKSISVKYHLERKFKQFLYLIIVMYDNSVIRIKVGNHNILLVNTFPYCFCVTINALDVK